MKQHFEQSKKMGAFAEDILQQCQDKGLTVSDMRLLQEALDRKVGKIISETEIISEK